MLHLTATYSLNLPPIIGSLGSSDNASIVSRAVSREWLRGITRPETGLGLAETDGSQPVATRILLLTDYCS
jgi:hypothetical protein